MDHEPAYITVDWVGRRVESAHANNSTLTLPLLLLLLRCCCCCVPKMSMCPSITRFPCRYVGVFYVGDIKNVTKNNRVGFSLSAFLGNRKNDFKKSVFGCEKTKEKKNDRKKRLSVFGSQPCSYSRLCYVNCFCFVQPTATTKTCLPINNYGEHRKAPFNLFSATANRRKCLKKNLTADGE